MRNLTQIIWGKLSEYETIGSIGYFNYFCRAGVENKFLSYPIEIRNEWNLKKWYKFYKRNSKIKVNKSFF